jgi:hypothetical protein
MRGGNAYSPLHGIHDEGTRAADSQAAEEDGQAFGGVGFFGDSEGAWTGGEVAVLKQRLSFASRAFWGFVQEVPGLDAGLEDVFCRMSA